jgi:hypothetical protein
VSLFPELNYDETAGMADRSGGGGGGLACSTLRCITLYITSLVLLLKIIFAMNSFGQRFILYTMAGIADPDPQYFWKLDPDPH